MMVGVLVIKNNNRNEKTKTCQFSDPNVALSLYCNQLLTIHTHKLYMESSPSQIKPEDRYL